MATRIITGVVLAPLVVYLFLWGPDWANALFFIAVAWIGAFELFRILFPGHWGLAEKTALGMTALLPVVGWLDARNDVSTWPVFFVLGLGVVLVAKLFRPAPIEDANDATGRLVLAYAYGGLLFLFPLLLALHYRPWLMVLTAAVWLGDTGAYFAGKSLGRNKLYPAISPKKTIEGSIGGLIASGLGGWLAVVIVEAANDPWPTEWAPMAPVLAVAFGVVCGATEQVGDLVESMMKRSAKVKDSGTILPGHGGILDRFDGFVFAAPFLYALVAAVS